MYYSSIVSWIVRKCTDFRRSQRKTLADLVVGAMRCRRVSLADIGRSMHAKTTPKHCIKRVWRFLRNPRVLAADGARTLLTLAAKASGGRLVIAVDWVDIRRDQVLRAATPLRGRSLPVLFAAYRKWQLHRSRNSLEDAFFVLLKTLAPRGCEVTIVADRGFTRADLARTLQEIGVHYVIRVRAGTWFVNARHSGALRNLELSPGKHRDFGMGAYRKRSPVPQRIVGFWKRRESEPWLLATDLMFGWRNVAGVYELRMKIEELFRDEKNVRFGWGLRQSQLSEPERLERLLLVLAFAYWFLLMLGLVCQDTMSPGAWGSSSSRRRTQASVFFVGRYMQDKVRIRFSLLLQAFENEILQIAEANWG